MTGQAENPYEGLRNLALGMTRAALKIDESGSAFGVLMETGYPKAVVTLACFLNGDTSLYFSNGGGMIGAGGHRTVADAAKVFVQKCDGFIEKMDHAADSPLPVVGRTAFYILTDNGALSHSETEEDLGQRRSDFSPLFYAGQDVITQIRLLQR